MGSLAVGDEICTPDGGVSKVAGVFPQGVKPVYKITFSDGSSTRCCEDHLWKIQYQQEAISVVISTKDLKGIYRAKETPERGSRRATKIPITKPVHFPKKEYAIHPYILGALIGDGCFRGRGLAFTSSDPEIPAEISRLLPSGYQIVHDGGIGYRITLKERAGNSRHEIIEELRQLGLWGKLSIEKSIPECYLYGCAEDRISLLRGLMDTDGCIAKGNLNFRGISFGTSSHQLAKDVQFLVQSLGGTAVISPPRKTTHADAYKIYLAMPNEINPFFLPRKADLVMHRTKYFPRRLIDSIEPDGEEECQCIFINDGKHLYLTDEFIVTHNTYTAIAYAIDHMLDDPSEERKLILTRPAVEACGEELGALPGGIAEKMQPFLHPLTDTIREYAGETKILYEVRSMAHLRGITLKNTVLVVDEAQNASWRQLKLILTRIGNGSKIILCGDGDQADIRDSGLMRAAEALEGINGIAHFHFSEVAAGIRHPLIPKILKAMKQ